MADFASYSTLNLNVSHIPVQLISGLCLPIECTPDKLSTFGNTVTTKLNDLIRKVQKNRHILPMKDDSGLLRNFTQLQVQIEPSSYLTEVWKQDVRVGYIISLCFCALVFICFCVIPNALVCWNHYKEEEVDPNTKLDWQYQQFLRSKNAEIEQASGQNSSKASRDSMSEESKEESLATDQANRPFLKPPKRTEVPQTRTTEKRTERRTDTGTVPGALTVYESMLSGQSAAKSLFTSRICHITNEPEPVEAENANVKKEQASMASFVLSFSILRSWESLSSTRCKLWDDRELDIVEGFKFFSFFLGQLCITAQFLMCTQTINPWMIERFFQELIFTIVISSNVVMEAFTAFSCFFGAYKLF